MADIEYVSGSEKNGRGGTVKFLLKGLEQWRVREEFPEAVENKRLSYQGYVCLGVPHDTTFSIFYGAREELIINDWRFWICRAVNGIYPIRLDAPITPGFIGGSFEVLAYASGFPKASRLMDWWNKASEGDHSVEYARHCAHYITQRGVKTPPVLFKMPQTV